MADDLKDVVKDVVDKVDQVRGDITDGLEAAHQGDVIKTLDAAEGAVDGAVAIVDEVEEAFLTTTKGWPLHDPTQKVTIPSGSSVKAKVTDWVKGQIEAGLVALCAHSETPVQPQPHAGVTDKE